MRRKGLVVVEFVTAALLGVIGVPLILFAVFLGFRAGNPQEVGWYEATALIPLAGAVFSLAGAGWLIRDARGQLEGLTWDQRRDRERLRDF